MTKQLILNYILPMDDIEAVVSQQVPEIGTFAVQRFCEEFSSVSLFSACAWLSRRQFSGFSLMNHEFYREELKNNILQMSKGFMLENMGGIGHQLFNTGWHITDEVWAQGVASFAYSLVITILSQTDGLLEYMSQFNENTLNFAPQRIWSTPNKTYAFRLSLFNTPVLSAF